MYKVIVLSVFVVMMLGVLFLASNIKEAYKVLPGSMTTQLTVDPYADWREFIPQSQRFKVMLPASPQYAKDKVNIPNTDKKRRYEMYASEKLNGTVFMVSVISYPADYDMKHNSELHSVVDELAASSPDNRLMETKETTFQTYPALDFRMQNQEFDIEGKTFQLDKVVYVLTYVARARDYEAKDYQHFIDSFELLPNAKEKS